MLNKEQFRSLKKINILNDIRQLTDFLPCGCRSYFEPFNNPKHKNTRRLIILVNPNCELDKNKIGKINNFVRYIKP